jgi:DNA-binding response OmpR family regulator
MPNVVRFGSFEVDLSAGQLRKRGVKIKLRDQSFQVLESLLEHPGQVVTREELHRRLWQSDVYVDYENSLNTTIARLREALAGC